MSASLLCFGTFCSSSWQSQQPCPHHTWPISPPASTSTAQQLSAAGPCLAPRLCAWPQPLWPPVAEATTLSATCNAARPGNTAVDPHSWPNPHPLLVNPKAQQLCLLTTKHGSSSKPAYQRQHVTGAAQKGGQRKLRQSGRTVQGVMGQAWAGCNGAIVSWAHGSRCCPALEWRAHSRNVMASPNSRAPGWPASTQTCSMPRSSHGW